MRSKGARCRQCFELSHRQGKRRFFRDRKADPFVVVLDRLYMFPVLIAKQHEILKNSERTKALVAIKAVANRVFDGSLYYLKTYQNRGHYSVLAKRVERKNGSDGFLVPTVQELKCKMAAMAGGGRSEETEKE